MRWTARWYKESDDEQLFNLVRSDLAPNRSYDEWCWAFKGNPVRTPVAVAEAEDGSIVGQYAVSDIPVRANGTSVKMAVSVDTVVRKDFQRQGIFIKLAEMVYSAMGLEYQAVITYPGYHRNSTPGLLKLGFLRICSLACATGSVAKLNWDLDSRERQSYRPLAKFNLDAAAAWKYWRFSRPNAFYVWENGGEARATESQIYRLTDGGMTLIYTASTSIADIYDGAMRVAKSYGRDRLTFYGAAYDPLIKDLSDIGFDVGTAGYDFMIKPLRDDYGSLLNRIAWYPQAGWFDVF